MLASKATVYASVWLLKTMPGYINVESFRK